VIDRPEEISSREISRKVSDVIRNCFAFIFLSAPSFLGKRAYANPGAKKEK
jgi:hypothetical protein